MHTIQPSAPEQTKARRDLTASRGKRCCISYKTRRKERIYAENTLSQGLLSAELAKIQPNIKVRGADLNVLK